MKAQRTGHAGTIGSHALVIGGSIAGLLAARVLTEHFERVTLIERDLFPDGPEQRKGVPQGRHAHGLLTRGHQIIERLFPGITASLVKHDASILDIAADVTWYHFGGYKVRFPSDMTGPFMSRPLLEWEVRRRVLALPNLLHRDGCEARALLASANRSRVIGVQFQGRGEGEAAETLSADLVVDASGRGSQTPAWLESLGYARPDESVVKVNVGYASRFYRRRIGDLPGTKAVYMAPMPPLETRGGALFPIERDRWIVSLMGWLGDHPPADERSFLEFARTLPASDIYDFVKDAEPLTEPILHKLPSNLRRRYEHMTRFPDGLVVLGDALCSFNPVYGQGMTASAMAADALAECLRQQWWDLGTLRGFPRRFFRRAAKVIDTPWMLAAGEDFRFPGAEGVKPLGTDLINWYVGKLHRAATHDPKVYRGFLRVMSLIDAPSTLFRPRMLLRVLGSDLRDRRTTAPIRPRRRAISSGEVGISTLPAG
jgi:2-polyprenyl-6-methoxyphenol hydroxylase-like FAD-dependent oxidoreductase